ncbi:hypothetical protein FRX31_022460 [Thalictrum thalictroides]|uniref:F-box protein At3g26010-like beta-propeller domain-containing protein n=1 Tax=Thalictrum thalictroides TaxID=46969 RepID=A0A7J6VU86_THATH|nr:hypothetical protein FRX31_022460 [Thalictrum thalictroides]
MNNFIREKRQKGSILSDEIITYEILPWLPIKPLFRFKLVCKEWCTLISTDSVFKTIQSQRCANLPPTGLIYFGIHSYVFLSTTISEHLCGLPDPSLKYTKMCNFSHFPVFNHLCNRSLLASSNGLLCGAYYKGSSEFFYVTNPVTKELVSIPNSTKLRDIALAFEPSCCNPYYVLVGRNVINVTLDQNCNGNDITEVGFTVYSSKVGIWNIANAKIQIFRRSFGHIFPRTLSRSVFTGGKLHWKLDKDVLWFDIEEDITGVVAVPGEEDKFSDGEIGGCNGELSYTNMSDSNIEIWVLRSNQKTEFMWVKKYCLSLRRICEDNVKAILACYDNMLELTRTLSGGANYRRPLPYEGGDVLLFWVKNIAKYEGGIIFSFNMKTGSLHLNHKSQLRRWEGPLISYRSSLVSLPEQEVITKSALMAAAGGADGSFSFNNKGKGVSIKDNKIVEKACTGDGSQGGSHEDLNNARGLMTGNTLPVPVENIVEQEVVTEVLTDGGSFDRNKYKGKDVDVKEAFVRYGSLGGSYDCFLTNGTGKSLEQLKELQNIEKNHLRAQIAMRDDYIAEFKKYMALKLSKKDDEIAELRAELAKKG